MNAGRALNSGTSEAEAGEIPERTGGSETVLYSTGSEPAHATMVCILRAAVEWACDIEV